MKNETSEVNNTNYNNTLTVTVAPKAVVILLAGLNSYLSQDDNYNPLTKKIFSTANWSSLNYDFDFYNTNFLNNIASTGAVILPFSYNGANLTKQNGSPIFSVKNYTIYNVGDMSPDIAAEWLNLEVQSIQRVWSQSKIIIIGHSEGGLVAERYFMDYYDPSTAKNVIHIFSLDSPINGVSADFIPTLVNLESNHYLGSYLLSYYNSRWNEFKQNGENDVINKDEADGNLYIPIGTPNDMLYDWASGSIKNILLPQLLYDNHSRTYNFYVTTPDSPDFSAFDVTESHHYVLKSPAITKFLTDAINGVLDAGIDAENN